MSLFFGIVGMAKSGQVTNLMVLGRYGELPFVFVGLVGFWFSC